MSLDIDARTIPHKDQRYPTVGDWYYANGTSFVRVSDMGNPDFEFLVMIHELIEQHLCQKRGVTEQAVDAFDVQFERDRPEGDITDPGDDQNAPYYDEHQYASGIERMLAVELGVDWGEYCAAIDVLDPL